MHFVLEPAGENTVHIAVKNNCGKIAAVSDGIAMYYKKNSGGQTVLFCGQKP